MHILLELVSLFSKLAVALVINISLFMLIPAGHSVFQVFREEKKEEAQQRRIVAEVVKPKQKEQKKVKRSRIRSVQSSGAKEVRNPMKFKFSPDLAVEGGEGGVAIAGQELEAEVFEEGETDQPAVKMYTPFPKYPARMREMGVEGEVLVTFVVGADGRVATIEKIDSPHPGFDAEVRRVLKQWKFKPATNKGVPVRVKMRVPFDFRLDA